LTSDIPSYTPKEIDALALAACETVVAEPGKVCAYDVEAYERIDRCGVATGAYPYHDPKLTDAGHFGGPLPPGCIGDTSYHLRINGFRRDGIFGPDESGKMLADAGIAYSDSLGHGLFEHLILCRQYGVMPIFEAPAMGFPMPFCEQEFGAFRRIYQQQLAEYVRWIQGVESIYGHPILKRPGQPWILWSHYSPLALFMVSASRKPEQTALELKSACGEERLIPNPHTPSQRAAQLRAWAFIRRRHMKVRAMMAEMLREHIAPDAILMDNTHTLPIVDYGRLGEIYDHPGVAVRSGYLQDPDLRQPNVAYSVRLFSDLTGKSPIVSVRINTTASGTRVIPGPGSIRNWCDAALRHGVAGYYFWPVDYPSCDGQYFGAMAGNSDPSCHGRQRWDAMLEVFSDVAGARCFQPPPANIGVLVPYDYLDLEGWRQVMAQFVELENKSIWSRLIGGRDLERNGGVLDNCKVLIVPSCPFASDTLVGRVAEYVCQGGLLVVTDENAMRYDIDGKERKPLAGLVSIPFNTVDAPAQILGEGQVYFEDEFQLEKHLRGISTEKWVYQIHTRNVRKLTGQIEGCRLREPEPDIHVRHYMYEHSSPAIFPYLDKRTDFPDMAD